MYFFQLDINCKTDHCPNGNFHLNFDSWFIFKMIWWLWRCRVYVSYKPVDIKSSGHDIYIESYRIYIVS